MIGLIKKINIFILILTTSVTTACSQDLRGGEIRLSQISGMMFGANIFIYQQISTYVNRPYVLINWGDGSPLDTCTGGSPITVAPDIYKSGYLVPPHIYSNYGNYIISVRDSFRTANIQNITPSGSEQLYVETNFTLNSLTWLGYNSPGFSNDQTVVVNNNGTYTHNPSAFDPDGDSLSYGLIPCYTTNYNFPSTAYVNPSTGEFSMTPSALGTYAIAIKVYKWRTVGSNKILIGSSIRDMLINVTSLASVSQNNTLENDVSVFPNPSTGIFTISSSEKISVIEIYNTLGQIIYQSKVQSPTSNIDLSDKPKGIYFLRIIAEDKTYTQKLIIQ